MTQGARVLPVLILLQVGPLMAQDLPLNLTLEDYTTLAIKQGIQGRQNALAFESAGYTREIAFRQTDSPTLAANGSVNRSETQSAGTPGVVQSDTAQGGLVLRELLPTGTLINAQGQTNGARSSGLGADASSTQNVFTASVVQPIYIFVKNSVLRTRRQADLSYENARDTFDSGLLSLRTQARNLYYQVMLGDESIKVEERKVASSQKLLDITQAMVRGGKTAAVETMRAKLRVQTDQRQLQNAVVNRNKAILNAKNFIFSPLEQPIQFSTQLEFRPLKTGLDRLTAFALLHNPQLKTLRRNRELADLGLQTARETTRPTLSLNSSYNYAENSGAVNRGLTVGGATNWLFFDAFVTRDNVSKARISVVIADLNLANGERTTQLNVNNAFLDVKNAEKQIIDFASSREQARHNVDVLRIRFQNGLERLIDVFDAENDMRNLDNEYLRLLVSFNQLKDNLSQLLGTDVEKVPG